MATQHVAQVNVMDASLQSLAHHFSVFPNSQGYQIASHFQTPLQNVGQARTRNAPIAAPAPGVLGGVRVQTNPQTCEPYLSFHHPGITTEEMLADVILDLPSVDVLLETHTVPLVGAANTNRRRYLESSAANISKLAAAMVNSMSASDQALNEAFGGNLTPLKIQHARWGIQDMARIFQMMALPQTLNPSVPSAEQFSGYLNSITTSVPRAILRNASQAGLQASWSDRELFDKWRNFLYGTSNLTNRIGHEQSHFYSEEVIQDYADMPQFLPLTAHNLVTALGQTPTVERGLLYSIAVNNLQALAWYLKLVMLQYSKLVEHPNYKVTLSVTIERYDQEVGMGPGGGDDFKHAHLNAVLHSLAYSDNTQLIAAEIIKAINALCYMYQENYNDESDTMAIIRSVTVIPTDQNAPVRQNAIMESLRVQPTRLTRHMLPSWLKPDSLGQNPFGAMTVQRGMPMNMGEAAGHVRSFLRSWLSHVRVHARPRLLPVQCKAIMDCYEVKHPDVPELRHQCFAMVMMLLKACDERRRKNEEDEWECQSFLPSANQMMSKSFKSTFTPREPIPIEKAAQEVREKINHWDHPTVPKEEFQTTYTTGCLMDCLKMYKRLYPQEDKIYLLLMQVKGSNVKTLLVEVTLSADEDPSPIDCKSLPEDIPYCIAILCGHAFLMNRDSVQVFLRETVLPCYGSESVMIHHNKRQFSKYDEYELSIPKPINYKWDDHTIKSKLYDSKGFEIEHISTNDSDPFDTVRVFAYDCETGSCDKCSEGTTHPVMVCLGINLTTIKTFSGPECPRRRQAGCYTKMVSFLNEVSSAEPGTKFILTAHYGSKFDHQFLMQTLLALQIPISIVKAESKIQQIRFFTNVYTVDTANIHMGSLEKVSSTALKDPRVKERLPANYITAGKYEAFPYQSLDLKYNMEFISLEKLATDEAMWGGKRCKGYDGKSVAEANTLYLQTHFPDCFEDGQLNILKITRQYCEEDVRLLMTINVMHYTVMCRTPMNNQVVDLTSCITASSFAWTTFKGCFLDIDLKGRNRTQTGLLGISYKLPYMTEPVPMYEADMVDHMIQGGLTTNNLRLLRSPDKDILCLDENSAYPSFMTQDLPHEFIRATHYPGEGVSLSLLLKEGRVAKTDWVVLYCADFRGAPFKSRPYTVKFNGVNIGPDYIPMTWFDSRGNIQWHVRYVGELLAYTQFEPDDKPFFKVRCVLHYKSAPIFRKFAETLYEQRLQAKAIGDMQTDGLNKLLLNSTFGKTCQREKESTVFLDKEEQVMALAEMKGGITSVEMMQIPVCNPVDLESPIQLQVLQIKTTNERLGPGEHAVVGASILALARGGLAKVLIEVEMTFKDAKGRPLMSPQGDTDSIILQEPTFFTDQDERNWESFKQRHMHETRLGAWKIESRTRGVFYGAGKKNYCIARVDADGSEHIEKMACKGAPKKIVEKKGTKHFRDMVYGETRQVEIPVSYKVDRNYTMIRTSIMRNLRAGNTTRIFPEDPEEWSQSYPTLNDYFGVFMARAGKTADHSPFYKYLRLPDAQDRYDEDFFVSFEE